MVASCQPLGARTNRGVDRLENDRESGTCGVLRSCHSVSTVAAATTALRLTTSTAAERHGQCLLLGIPGDRNSLGAARIAQPPISVAGSHRHTSPT